MLQSQMSDNYKVPLGLLNALTNIFVILYYAFLSFKTELKGKI